MALYYRLSELLPIDGFCFGNFLSKKSIQMVFADGNDLVFRNIFKNKSDNEETRTRINASGCIHQISRIPAKAFDSNEYASDGLLIYTRCTKSDEVVDIVSIRKFDPASSEVKTVRTEKFLVPKDFLGSSRVGRVSINEIEDSRVGSIIFSNGHNDAVYMFDSADKSGIIELKSKNFAVREPSSAYWLNDNNIAIVLDRDFTNTLLVVDISKTKISKSKHGQWSSKLVSGRVKYVGPVPLSDDSILVLFSHGYQLLRFSKKGIQDEKEFKLNLSCRSPRSWFHIGSTQDGDSFYISTSQEILLLRKLGEPVLLAVQEGIKGTIKSVGSGIFAVDSGGATHFCRYRLNKKRTNIFADFLGILPKSPDDLTSVAQTRDDHWGSRFWWRNGVDTIGNLYVTQHTTHVAYKHISLNQENVISRMWTTSTKSGLECVLATTNTSSYLLNIRDQSFVSLTDASWQKHDDKTLYVDYLVQVTPSTIIWKDSKTATLEGALSAAGSENMLLVNGNNWAYVYINQECIKKIHVSETIIDIDCNDRYAAISSSNRLYSFNTETRIVEDYIFDKFGTAIKLIGDEVYVGSNDGTIISFFDSTEFSLSLASIKSMCSSPVSNRGFLATDMMSNTFVVDNDRQVTRLSTGGLNWICSLNHIYIGSFDGIIGQLEFDTKHKYQLTEIPVAAGAQSIHFIDSEVYALYWSLGEVAVATTSNILDWKKFKLPSSRGSEGEASSQLFMINKDYFSQIMSTQPSDVDSSSEMEGDDADAFFEVPLTIRLFHLDRELQFMNSLCEKSVTVDGDPYDEVIVKLLNTDAPNSFFYVFTQSASAVCGKISKNGMEIDLKVVRQYVHEDVYYDHWSVNPERHMVTAVGHKGYVCQIPYSALCDLNVPDVDLVDSSKQEIKHLPSIAHTSKDMVLQAIDLGNQDGGQSRMYAASMRHQTVEQLSVIILFALKGEKIEISSNITLPHRKISMVAASHQMSHQDNIEPTAISPTLYLGASSGDLYAVSYCKDSGLFHSLQSIQSKLLEDMGFLKRPGHADKSVDGSLSDEAAKYDEMSSIFKDNNISIERSTDMLKVVKS